MNRVSFSGNCPCTNNLFVLECVEDFLTVELNDPRGVAKFIPVKDGFTCPKEFRGLLFHPRRRVRLDYNVSDVAVYNVSDVVLVGGKPIAEDSESLDDSIVASGNVIDEFKSETGEGFSCDSSDVTDEKDFTSSEAGLAEGDGVVFETSPAIPFCGSDDDIVCAVHSLLIKSGVHECSEHPSLSAIVAR